MFMRYAAVLALFCSLTRPVLVRTALVEEFRKTFNTEGEMRQFIRSSLCDGGRLASA